MEVRIKKSFFHSTSSKNHLYLSCLKKCTKLNILQYRIYFPVGKISTVNEEKYKKEKNCM